jgi:hypothetical protein
MKRCDNEFVLTRRSTLLEQLAKVQHNLPIGK